MLAFVITEVERQGGRATVYTDMLEPYGSKRVFVPAMAELHALGLLDVERRVKNYVCALSDGWRDVTSKHEALLISARARNAPSPVVKASQPESDARS